MTEKTSRGDFFAIDARTWHKACSIGMNPAVAYLVMARGTGGDQITTSWSVKAIEKYTNISRPLAKTAIQALATKGLIDVLRAGKRPQYRLRPWSEFSDQNGAAHANGTEPPVPHWIWLPNALIDGVPGNAGAPVELIRQTQKIEALRLLVDLYKVHDLAAFGGVHWRILRKDFERQHLGDWNENSVWGFKPRAEQFILENDFFAVFTAGRSRADGMSAIWDAFDVLQDFGFFEFVPHLIEADNEEASIIHPFGWGAGEPAERRLAVATHKVGRTAKGISQPTGGMLVLAKKHMQDIAMVGVLRLLYKPHTQATAVWISRMAEWDALAADREREAGSRLIGRSRAA